MGGLFLFLSTWNQQPSSSSTTTTTTTATTTASQRRNKHLCGPERHTRYLAQMPPQLVQDLSHFFLHIPRPPPKAVAAATVATSPPIAATRRGRGDAGDGVLARRQEMAAAAGEGADGDEAGRASTCAAHGV